MATINLQSLPEYSEVDQKIRTKYWMQYCLDKHRADFGFLLKIAKLGKKPREMFALEDGEARLVEDGDTDDKKKFWVGWNNVMKHNVTQAAALRVLLKAMGYEDGGGGTNMIGNGCVTEMEKYSFIHNPGIHLQKQRRKEEDGINTKAFPKSEKFTWFEECSFNIWSDALHDEVDSGGFYQLATSPEFFDQIAEMQMPDAEDIVEKAKHVPFDELLIYYIDALFDDSNLIPAHERIALMEQRRPDLNDDEKRTERLGMKYWDAERAVSTMIQEMVWEEMKHNGIELASHEDVPEFLRKQIAQEMLAL